MKSYSIKILIAVIICNLVALAGYYFLFQQIITKTQAASSFISTIDLGQQKNSRLNSLRTIVKDTEGKRQQLETFLLTSDTEISFIEQVEAMAKNSNLEAKTNRVSAVSVDTSTTKIFQM